MQSSCIGSIGYFSMLPNHRMRVGTMFRQSDTNCVLGFRFGGSRLEIEPLNSVIVFRDRHGREC